MESSRPQYRGKGRYADRINGSHYIYKYSEQPALEIDFTKIISRLRREKDKKDKVVINCAPLSRQEAA
jgi:hypothetical protein